MWDKRAKIRKIQTTARSESKKITRNLNRMVGDRARLQRSYTAIDPRLLQKYIEDVVADGRRSHQGSALQRSRPRMLPAATHITAQGEQDVNLPSLARPHSTAAGSHRAHSMSREGYYDTDMPRPINNFYQRLAKQNATKTQKVIVPHRVGQSYSSHFYQDPGPPVNKAGRLGAPWRHIRQTTGYGGNHICFVDGKAPRPRPPAGVVKQDDLKTFPPYGMAPQNDTFVYLPPTSASAVSVAMDQASQHRSLDSQYTRKSAFNQHAKLGFKYWYDDRKAVPSGPKRTIGGHLMKIGVGY